MRRWLAPPDLGDPDRNRIARTQHWLLSMSFALSVGLLVVIPLLGQSPRPPLVIYGCATLLTGTCLLLLHSGRPRVSGYLFSGGVYLIGVVAAVAYGVGSAALVVPIVAVVMAGFFGGARSAWVMAALCCVTFFGLTLATEAGALPSPRDQALPRVWFSTSALFFLTAALMQLAFRGIDRCGAARAGRHEPRHQRARRDARWRRDLHRDRFSDARPRRGAR